MLSPHERNENFHFTMPTFFVWKPLPYEWKPFFAKHSRDTCELHEKSSLPKTINNYTTPG